MRGRSVSTVLQVPTIGSARRMLPAFHAAASKVLTWCPTCTKNFGELEEPAGPPSFDLGHVSEFLAANLDELKKRFVPGLPKRRVVIHEHQGIGATLESMRKLLSAVPNVELLEIPKDSGFSYACGEIGRAHV